MRNFSLSSVVFALCLTACAAAPGDIDDTDDSEEDTNVGDGGAKRDAGKTTSTTRDGGTTSKSDAGSSTTTSNPLAGLGGILGIGSTSDAGKAAPTSSGDGGANKCENLVCFDVFDCAIFHPDALDCGFTACTGFVCVK